MRNGKFRLTEEDIGLFHRGIHYEIYKKLGSHWVGGKTPGVYFAVYAPNARSVSVIGEFNGWQLYANPMQRYGDSGFFELFLPDLEAYVHYKYAVETGKGEILYKADPYANRHGFRPDNTSVVCKEPDWKWSDGAYLKERKNGNILQRPLSIYEVHIGSWKRHHREEFCGFYNYRTFAHEIVAYFQEMPYTHVELMGILEYPLDASWGYQVTGYFAPTVRYGTMEDFLYMINYLHQNGIGVLLDWVPAHFPKDPHGLAMFDGTALYEYEDPRKGEHPDWGTKVFDYSKPEVRNFLIASALFFIEQCHIDGLRVDAVSSMLYLDYGRQGGDWVPNIYGGKENLEAIEFFRHLNSIAKLRNPNVLMIAEESTAWEGVTRPAGENGLHFDMKWNMGWMHDFLDYLGLSPAERKNGHNKMNFAMSYQYSEHFILVLSHDEVVHGKGALLEKMSGYEPEKYANLLLGYTFMMTHPGKKLLFMGQEFAQRREWSEERELDWYLLGDERHGNIKKAFGRLLSLYRSIPALYELDDEPAGFEWLDADDSGRCTFGFVRHARQNGESLVCIFNFTEKNYDGFRTGVPVNADYQLLFDTDDREYGGEGRKRMGASYPAERVRVKKWDYSISFGLGAYEGLIFRYQV